jgi:Raf kinase inhibitor-like YbhB/YbcL family protein
VTFKIIIILIVLALIGGAVFFYFNQKQNSPQIEPELKGNMKLTSAVFQNNQSIPSKYTCDGEDINPPLEISDVLQQAKSLVLIMDDPDAPSGTWDHWIVFNIPPDTKSIAEGKEPAGIHGKGTSGNLEYHGPCPPDREHRYFFKLYALDTDLNLAEGSTKKQVESAMQGHIIDQTQLIGLYTR